MCGSPAVPSTSASPRLMKSNRAFQSPPYFSPGARNALPWPLRSAAVSSSRSTSPWKRSRTRTVSTTVPPSSRTAFTIWIQVVALIPPNDT
ncbi:hypothetical protein SCANM63S_08934 [Streptomyces canarius]